MEKVDPKSIGDLMKDFLNQRNVGVAMMEGKAKDVFKSIAGDYVSSYVEDVYLRNGILYITVSSAVVKSEINMRRRFYMKSVNELLGGYFVKSISLK